MLEWDILNYLKKWRTNLRATSFFLSFYSDYYVLELDQDEYNYALIGSSSDKYLWILSRAPILPEEIKKKLLDAATRRGYDVKKLIWVEQREKKIM